MTDEPVAAPAAETIWIQGEGRMLGFSADCLPPGITARMASGELRRVSEDGSPWIEPDEDEREVPAAKPPAEAHVPPPAFPAARPVPAVHSEPVVPSAHIPPPAQG